MSKKILLFISILASFTALAQKTISLEDAVLQQNRQFRADKLLNFQWVPGTGKYVYLDDNGKKLMTASVSDEKAIEMVTLADLNKATGADFRSFTGISWKDSNTFILANGSKYYEYSIQSRSGKQIAALPESAENAALDKSSQYIAYTEKNNLYFLDRNGQKVTVTNESNENIISGQFFARNEFGINNGIFWSPKSAFLAFYQKDQTEVADYPILDIT